MVNTTRGVDTCPQPVFTDVDLSYTDHVISPTGVTTELVFHSGTFPFNRGTSIGFKVSVADGVWQSRADVRQQDLLLYEQRGCTDRMATCLVNGSFPPDTRLSPREGHLGVPSTEFGQLLAFINGPRSASLLYYISSTVLVRHQ